MTEESCPCRVLSRVFERWKLLSPKILLSLWYIGNYIGKIIQTQQGHCTHCNISQNCVSKCTRLDLRAYSLQNISRGGGGAPRLTPKTPHLGNPLVRVTLAPALLSLLVNRALERTIVWFSFVQTPKCRLYKYYYNIFIIDIFFLLYCRASRPSKSTHNSIQQVLFQWNIINTSVKCSSSSY